MAANYGPTDLEAEARIQAEIRAEEETIAKVCNDRGLHMYEVGQCIFDCYNCYN
jgi:hypothetical protein